MIFHCQPERPHHIRSSQADNVETTKLTGAVCLLHRRAGEGGAARRSELCRTRMSRWQKDWTSWRNAASNPRGVIDPISPSFQETCLHLLPKTVKSGFWPQKNDSTAVSDECSGLRIPEAPLHRFSPPPPLTRGPAGLKS